MSNEKKTVEISAETVELALQRGLEEMGLTRDQVSVEIVDEGRRGFLGVGNRDVVLRLTQIDGVPARPSAEVTKAAPNPVAADPTPKATVAAPETAPVLPPKPEFTEPELTREGGSEFDELDALPDPELLEEEETAVSMIGKLLDKMGIDATVDSSLTEEDDLGKQVIELDVQGPEVAELIGRQGETLVALQYIGRLMVSQQLRRKVEFVIDVDGYRRKRREGLSRLAQRMADKVIKRNRPVTLEPMSSYERRLVHVALRDHAKVTTRSIGEGRERRVRILPK